MKPRAAIAADLPALAVIWRIGWHDAHFEHVPASLSAIRTPESFLARLTAYLDQTITIGPIGKPLGFTTIKGNEINQIFVSSAAQGKGIANTLISAGEAAIKSAGHTIATLDVIPENARAIAFYTKMGWKDRGIETILLEGDGKPYPLNCLVMQKELQ